MTGLKVILGNEMNYQVTEAVGWINSTYIKKQELYCLEACLKCTPVSDECLDRLGEFLASEFPTSFKAATVAEHGEVSVWVKVNKDTTRDKGHELLMRLKGVLRSAGFEGLLIGSIIDPRKLH
jgi:hypothetical protein